MEEHGVGAGFIRRHGVTMLATLLGGAQGLSAPEALHIVGIHARLVLMYSLQTMSRELATGHQHTVALVMLASVQPFQWKHAQAWAGGLSGSGES